jgi:thiol-disulfide isomerase/thioredoxin
MQNSKRIVLIIIVFGIGILGLSQAFLPPGYISSFLLSAQDAQPQALEFKTQKTKTVEQAFLADNLKTNTAIKSISLAKVLGGGPTKDGIPALTNPQYETVDKASNLYADNSEGVLLELNNEVHWYSFDVLYWHEIINETIGNTPVVVTFCPLCGSSIVYDRALKNGEILSFGVSGKLWQSNLLMYDQATESLWSQIEGEAKVGDYTGETLRLIDSSIVPWEEAKKIPNLKVLSQDTGYQRTYGQNPYGTYEQNADLMFPVDSNDQTLPPKTLMIAGTYKDIPFALERLPLLESAPINLSIASDTLAVTLENGRIFVRNETGQAVPTFNTMWFSWANHWRTDQAVIWTKNPATAATPTETSAAAFNQGVTLFEYFSYGCSYCDQIHDALDDVLKEFPEVDLKLKHFIVYEEYLPLHEAQVCAAEQGKRYEFHDTYFKNYFPRKDQTTATQIAQTQNLDMTAYNECLASERPQQKINQDMQEGIALGVRGTPTMLVSGKNLPLQVFSGRTESSIRTELQSLDF